MNPLKIEVRINQSAENLQRNIRYALSLELPEFSMTEEHDGRFVIVASGPSLMENVEEVRKLKERGDKIVCVNQAHDFLIDHGITPDICVLQDGWDVLTDYITPHYDVEYLVCAQCHPNTFDKLKGYRLTLWHAFIDDKSLNTSMAKMLDDGKERWMIWGGCTCALRCLNIGYMMGYRRFTLIGVDSSIREDGTHHSEPIEKSGPISTSDYGEVIPVHYNGRSFLTPTSFAAQAQDFGDLYTLSFPNCRIKAIGDGLIPFMCSELNRRRFGDHQFDF